MTDNSFSVLSYNLFYSKALEELMEVVDKHRPDIICVQECVIDQESVSKIESLGYELADYSYSFFKHFRIYSIATFFNPKRIEHNNGTSINLARGLYEILLAMMRLSRFSRTALNNNFKLTKSQRQFRVCNLHLSALQSSNKVRSKQICNLLDSLSKEANLPTVITGDFNYMYWRKGLEKIFKHYEFIEATNNIFFTIEWIFFKFLRMRWKTDYVWYKNITRVKVSKIDRQHSDHFPVLSEFEF